MLLTLYLSLRSFHSLWLFLVFANNSMNLWILVARHEVWKAFFKDLLNSISISLVQGSSASFRLLLGGLILYWLASLWQRKLTLLCSPENLDDQIPPTQCPSWRRPHWYCSHFPQPLLPESISCHRKLLWFLKTSFQIHSCAPCMDVQSNGGQKADHQSSK